MKDVDLALHHANQEGQNPHQCHVDRMPDAAIQNSEMESLLREALNRRELTLRYQPRVNVGNSRIVGVEALLCWRNPVLGDIVPADFMPLAEETGLIVSIGEWVLWTACAQARRWRELGLPPLRMAVNLSPRQCVDPVLTALIARILRETDLRSELLELELTESLLGKDDVRDLLRTLKRLGVRLVIDDFGAGYSTLAYLRRFPIDCIKIDKAFVRAIAEEKDEQTVAAVVIAIARSLRLDVTAEGVETRTQLTLLRALGCDEMQGFLFGQPYSAERMTQLLRDYHLHDHRDPIQSCHYNPRSSV